MREGSPKTPGKSDQFFNPLVRVVYTLDPVTDSGHRPNVRLHIGEELLYVHAALYGKFKPPSGIRHGSPKTRADHDNPGCHRLGHRNIRTCGQYRGKGAADAGPMVG